MSSAYHFSISNQLLYNDKAVYYSKNPLDLNGFENPYQYMLWFFFFFEGQQKQIHWNCVSKKNRSTFFLSTFWSNKNQTCEIVFIYWSKRIFWDFIGGGSRDGFTILVLSFLYTFYHRTFKRLVLPFKWDLKVHYYGRMYSQLVITSRKCPCV